MYVDYSAPDRILSLVGMKDLNLKTIITWICVDGVNGRVSGILVDSIALWIKQVGNAGSEVCVMPLYVLMQVIP